MVPVTISGDFEPVDAAGLGGLEVDDGGAGEVGGGVPGMETFGRGGGRQAEFSVKAEFGDFAVFELEADGGGRKRRSAMEAEGGPFPGGESLGELGGGGFAGGPGVGVGDDMAAGLASKGGEAATFAEEAGVVLGTGHLGLRIHVVEEVDAVGSAGEEGGGRSADGFDGVELQGAVGVVGAKEEFEPGGEDDAVAGEASPEFEGDVGFDGGPEGGDGEELNEVLAGPEGAVEAEGDGGLGA